jgi:hypothetical protein
MMVFCDGIHGSCGFTENVIVPVALPRVFKHTVPSPHEQPYDRRTRKVVIVCLAVYFTPKKKLE